MEGFESFLRVTPFTTLQKAAQGGPVIIINISRYRSDAVIIQADRDLISVHLPEAIPSAVEALVLSLNGAVGRHLEDNESNQILERVCQVI